MTKLKIINSNDKGFSIKINFEYNKSMLQGEQDILERLNEAGTIATGEILSRFDTDGTPIKMGNQTFRSTEYLV